MKKLIIILLFLTSVTYAQRDYHIATKQSLIGTHSLFHPTYQALPVFNHYIKKNIFGKEIQTFKTESDLEPIERQLLTSDSILNSQNGFIEVDEEYIAIKAYTILGLDGKSFTLYIKNNQETIHHLSHNHYLKDTTIIGTVFLPDPITSSGNNYGGDFSDNNDQTNSSLNNELYQVNIPATFDNGEFLLENNHLKITNQSSPDIHPTVLSDSNFKFNRSQQGFEEVNALYHISRFADYIKDTLGFSSLMNYQIHVDVYALNNNDQSEFVSSTIPPRLNFGQGCVDDAEDPDILIHEYSHALSHSAAQGTLVGYERQAMDEGYGDYWAGVYSKQLNENNYKTIFNWDGHNECWEGRSIDNNRKYSDGLDGNKYTDGELFAATLMDIRNHLEDSVADRIIIQSTFSWFPNMTFEDAADLILKTDTLLYENQNAGLLNWLFCKRGLKTENCENSITEIDWEPNIDYALLSQGVLRIYNLESPEEISILTTTGRLIQKNTIFQNNVTIPNTSKGIYLIQIRNKTFKVLMK